MPRTTCIQTWPGVVRAVPINDSTLMHLHSNCKSEYTCWEERSTSRAGQERDTPKAVAHLCWNCSTWARSSISAFLKQLDLCPQMGVYMLGGKGCIESSPKHTSWHCQISTSGSFIYILDGQTTSCVPVIYLTRTTSNQLTLWNTNSKTVCEHVTFSPLNIVRFHHASNHMYPNMAWRCQSSTYQ